MSIQMRRGLAILIVLGVLGTLAMLAICFVTLTQLERRASQRRIHQTQAVFLARSGIEDVQARMGAGQDPAFLQNRYGGEDADLSGAFSGTEAAGEIFRAGQLNVDICPLPFAMRPSFPVLAGSVPVQMSVEGRQRGYSGRLGQGSTGTQDTYALKVGDESGKINVNGGFLDAVDRDNDGISDCRDTFVSDLRPFYDPIKDTGRGWNAQLVRVLDILGGRPEVGLPALGTEALSRRPVKGYRSLRHLQDILSTTTDLSPFITVSSWTDAKVVHPNTFPSQDARTTLAGLNDVKKDRTQLLLEESGRPPVNLNAAPAPVLVALIQGLKGTTWQAVGVARTYQIDVVTALALTDRILERRASSPFSGWGDFSAFCDSMVDQDVITGMAAPMDVFGGGNLCGADLLKANFDPNTDLNKQLPDQLLWRWIDKSDLSVWSTEGSLAPTGIFHILSCGRLTDPAGRLLATSTLSVTVEDFRILRQTTQRDFVDGRPLKDYLSLSPGDTFGYRTTGAGSSCSWRDPLWAADQGLAAITYPSAPTALPAGASVVDGYIGLATVQEAEDFPAEGPLLFMHHLEDSLDADVGNPANRLAGPWDAILQTNLSQDIWPPTAAEPNAMLPDGLHSQPNRSLGFQAQGNLPADLTPSNHGVVSYWVKPGNAQKPINWGGAGPCYQWSCVRKPGAGLTQTFAIGEGELGYVGNWGFMMEGAAVTSDSSGNERLMYSSAYAENKALKPNLRWHLVTAWFDTDEQDPSLMDHLEVRGIRPYAPLQAGNYYSRFDPGIADITASGVAFVLGSHPDAGIRGGANQVIDEAAIYDFGDVGADTLNKARTLADNRYADGRYYKGDDAAFLSTILEPELRGSCRILSARWTAYLPRENRQEILVTLGTGMSAHGTARRIDTRLQDSNVELSLLDGNGTLTGPVIQPLSQGARIDLRLRRFRYRANFSTRMADATNQGVLETPFLDDITFTWQPATGPRILDWSAP